MDTIRHPQAVAARSPGSSCSSSSRSSRSAGGG